MRHLSIASQKAASQSQLSQPREEMRHQLEFVSKNLLVIHFWFDNLQGKDRMSSPQGKRRDLTCSSQFALPRSVKTGVAFTTSLKELEMLPCALLSPMAPHRVASERVARVKRSFRGLAERPAKLRRTLLQPKQRWCNRSSQLHRSCRLDFQVLAA